MLVLSRKRGESIMINKDIRITVEKIERGKVLLSFTAPEEVRIFRSEKTDEPPQSQAS